MVRTRAHSVGDRIKKVCKYFSHQIRLYVKNHVLCKYFSDFFRVVPWISRKKDIYLYHET